MRHELRTEERYFVIAPIAAEIDGGNAEVVDLSTKGARLQVTRSLTTGQAVPFNLRTGDVSIAVSATVVWCEIAALSMHDEEFDRYLCGIAFPRSMSVIRHVIDELVAARSAVPIEEIRSADRYRVVKPMTASFASYSSLRVLDLSVCGARINTPQLLAPGMTAPLRFFINGIESPVDLQATVMWARPAERRGRFECGLRITEAEEWLRTVIEELAMRDGVVIEADTLRRKFDPFTMKPLAGLVAIHR